MGRNNLQPTLKFQYEISMDHNTCFCIILLWMIVLLFVTYVLQLIFNVLVGSLHEDLGEDLGSWIHVTLEESLSITTLRCDLAIATHARKMHKTTTKISGEIPGSTSSCGSKPPNLSPLGYSV